MRPIAMACLTAWMAMEASSATPPPVRLIFDTDIMGDVDIEHWPTPVVFSGGELGIRVQTGAGLTKLPANSPVRRAYGLYNGVTNRASWDQTAVLYAVRGLKGGLKDVWDLHTRGSIGFDAKTAYVTWRKEGQRDHAYLVEKMPPKQVARMIEGLMLHLPAGSGRAKGGPKPEG